ncbi:hypothetical protein BU17DRAFT_85711 [Hysterangium stoloniferum]|nr:hypothetical protein BU17DRAFT_85711 [Hysterangium stoloniferum]
MASKLTPHKPILNTAGTSTESAYWTPLTSVQILEQQERQKKLCEEAKKKAWEDEEEMEQEYQIVLAAEKAEKECQRKDIMLLCLHTPL